MTFSDVLSLLNNVVAMYNKGYLLQVTIGTIVNPCTTWRTPLLLQKGRSPFIVSPRGTPFMNVGV